MLSKTTYYELFKPMAEVKVLLKQIAEGADMVSKSKNPYTGVLDYTAASATLTQKNSRIALKKYTVEVKESEGVAWLKIKVAPTSVAILIGVVLLLLAIAVLIGLPIPKIVLPLAIVLPYYYYITFAKDAHLLGAMLDPVYFDSPIAQAKVSSGFMGVLSGFTIPYYIICIIGIIFYFIYFYLKMFT